MAVENHELKTVMTSDTKDFDKSMKKVESTVDDIENKLDNAFGGLDKGFSKSVSSISETDKALKKMNKELDNIHIDVDGLDDFSKDILSSTDDVEALVDTITDIELGITGEDDLEDLIDTFGEASKEVELLEDALALIGKVDINLEDDMYKIVAKTEEATDSVEDLYDELSDIDGLTIDGDFFDDVSKSAKDAEGDVDRFDSTVNGLSGKGVKGVGSDFNKTGADVKDTEGDVDRFDSTVKGVDDGGSLTSITDQLENISGNAEDAAGMIEGLGVAIGGLAGLGGIEEMFEIAVDESRLMFDLETALSSGAKGGQRVNVDVALNAIGEDYATLSSVIGDDETRELIRTISLHADTTDAEEVVDLVNEIGKMSATVAIKYDANATEIYEQARKISTEIGITEKEAIALQDSLLAVGFPEGELDIIAEYGQQLTRAGFGAEDIRNIFAKGVDNGTWNIDNLLDGLKEGRVLIAEFGTGVDESMEEVLQGTGISAKQLEVWGKRVAEGGESGKVALLEVAKELDSMTNKTKQNELGVKFFGTMWEDQGENILGALFGVNDELETLEDGITRINEETGEIEEEPWLRIEKAMTKIQGTVGEMLAPIVETVANVAEWVSENERLVEILVVVIGTLAVLATALGVIASVMLSVTIIMGFLGITSLITFGLVIGAILAVVAVLYVMYQYWEELSLIVTGVLLIIEVAMIEFVGKMIESSRKLMSGILKVVFFVIDTIVNRLLNFMRTIGMIFGAIGEIIKFTVNGIIDLAVKVGGFLGLDLTEEAEELKNSVDETMDGIFWSISRKADDIEDEYNEFKQNTWTAFEETRDGTDEIMGAWLESSETRRKQYSADVTIYQENNKEQALTAGQEQVESYRDGIYSAKPSAEMAAYETEESVSKALGSRSSEVNESGRRVGSAYATGLEGTKGQSRGRAKELREETGQELNKGTDGFTKSGETVAERYSVGINRNSGKAKEETAKMREGAIEEAYLRRAAFETAGRGMAEGVAFGLGNSGGVVKTAMNSVLQMARNLLPFSPPKDKTSPLVDIHKNGIGTQIAEGIRSGQGEVDGAMRNLLDFGDMRANMGNFDLNFEELQRDMSAFINGNVHTTLGTNHVVNVNAEPANVNVEVVTEINGRQYDTMVRDIEEHSSKRRRMRNM